MSQATFYKHSGEGMIMGLVLGLGAGLPVAMVLATLYALATFYIPIAGYVTFIFAVIFGAAVSFTTTKIVKMARTRSSWFPLAISMVNVVLGFGFSWVVWTWAVLNEAGVEEITFVDLLFPWNLIIVILQINEVGAWSISGGTPTGIMLWILWLIEAALVLGAAIFTGKGFGDFEPYCENCGSWCHHMPSVAAMPGVDPDMVRQRLLASDFSILREEEELEVPEGPLSILQVNLYKCPGCGQTNTLTLLQVTPSFDKEGNRTDSIKSLIKRMLIRRDQVDQLVREV